MYVHVHSNKKGEKKLTKLCKLFEGLNLISMSSNWISGSYEMTIGIRLNWDDHVSFCYKSHMVYPSFFISGFRVKLETRKLTIQIK